MSIASARPIEPGAGPASRPQRRATPDHRASPGHVGQRAALSSGRLGRTECREDGERSRAGRRPFPPPATKPIRPRRIHSVPAPRVASGPPSRSCRHSAIQDDVRSRPPSASRAVVIQPASSSGGVYRGAEALAELRHPPDRGRRRVVGVRRRWRSSRDLRLLRRGVAGRSSGSPSRPQSPFPLTLIKRTGERHTNRAAGVGSGGVRLVLASPATACRRRWTYARARDPVLSGRTGRPRTPFD
jgi:hypothetical protein